MTKRLFFEAIAKFFAGLVMVSALLFLPAGTMDYPGGWLLIAILFIPMFLAGLVMMAVNPSLLRSRLNAKEKEREQDQVVKLSGLMFLCGFILAGLDFRFGWSDLPFAVNCVGAALFLLAYVLYAEVLRENTWLSRTIEVQDGHGYGLDRLRRECKAVGVDSTYLERVDILTRRLGGLRRDLEKKERDSQRLEETSGSTGN